MNATVLSAFIVAAAVITPAVPARADPIRLDAGFRTTSLPRTDDGSTGAVPLGFTLNFFGAARNTAFVNNNGNLTFGTSLGRSTPFDLTTVTMFDIIAPFFADVDTRNLGSAVVTFGQSTVNGHQAFGVNYVDVGYFGLAADKLNDFQVVLIDRSDVGAGDFDIEFNYADIRWETGSDSGGVDGFGGRSARAGYSRGIGLAGTFFELPGSGVNGAFLNGGPNALVSGSFNSAEPGRYLLEVRNGGGAVTPNNPFPPHGSIPGGPGEAPIYFFSLVLSGQWFDPPLVSSYRYTAAGPTLFTGLRLPGGFGDAFTLAAAGCTFAGPYSSLVLIDLVALCGGAGVGGFTVSGISPLADAGNPLGFPTFLTFNVPRGSFSMQGVTGVTSVPEPGTLTLLVASALALAGRSTRRRLANRRQG